MAGAILAGGRSTRFGRDKALTEVEGEAMVLRVFHALRAVADPCFVVLASEGAPNPLPALQSVIDSPMGVGPIGGLASALQASPSDWMMVLPCDMPFVTEADLNRLLMARTESVDAVVAEGSMGRRHPLCACYRSSVVGEAQERIAGGRYSLLGLIEAVRARYVQLPDRSLTNVNRPSDLPGSSDSGTGGFFASESDL